MQTTGNDMSFDLGLSKPVRQSDRLREDGQVHENWIHNEDNKNSSLDMNNKAKFALSLNCPIDKWLQDYQVNYC